MAITREKLTRKQVKNLNQNQDGFRVESISIPADGYEPSLDDFSCLEFLKVYTYVIDTQDDQYAIAFSDTSLSEKEVEKEIGLPIMY